MAVIQLNNTNFKKEVLESDLPVLLDFWAVWCVPCKKIIPILEELSGEYEEKLKIGKINVEENPKIANQYGVMSIPTLMILKKGKVLTQIIGGISKAELKRKIEANI